ncbi:phage protein NinX family protein [Burkholderia stabilis]|uniref:phage protein NinX family protein n=1 Tax=Burkholderia stabilis TaxID=95485 RepID=UPI001F4B3329|nr:phage protein NinX family protein [Burkholderia stabilis]
MNGNVNEVKLPVLTESGTVNAADVAMCLKLKNGSRVEIASGELRGMSRVVLVAPGEVDPYFEVEDDVDNGGCWHCMPIASLGGVANLRETLESAIKLQEGRFVVVTRLGYWTRSAELKGKGVSDHDSLLRASVFPSPDAALTAFCDEGSRALDVEPRAVAYEQAEAGWKKAWEAAGVGQRGKPGEDHIPAWHNSAAVQSAAREQVGTLPANQVDTVRVNIQELSGVRLDWAVARCEGYTLTTDGISHLVEKDRKLTILGRATCGQGIPCGYSPSNYWDQGGPIIWRQRISLQFCRDLRNRSERYIHASMDTHSFHGYWRGNHDSPLVAAMRCFVASKFGESINVPTSLKP